MLACWMYSQNSSLNIKNPLELYMEIWFNGVFWEGIITLGIQTLLKLWAKRDLYLFSHIVLSDILPQQQENCFGTSVELKFVFHPSRIFWSLVEIGDFHGLEMEKTMIFVLHTYVETQVGGAPPSVVLVTLVAIEGVTATVSKSALLFWSRGAHCLFTHTPMADL